MVPMLTNAEVAKRLGCSVSMVSKMRNGNRRPGGDILCKLVTEFGLEPMAAMHAYSSADRFGKFVERQVFARARMGARAVDKE